MSNSILMMDIYHMQEAIKEGEKGRATAPPNPWVGAIIVNKDGRVIGRGYHHQPGQPHGEIMAMNDVADKDQLIGSTIYSTLEPCSHHGRTGPCCEAIVKAGISRCVVGILDPDKNVSSSGIAYLQEHSVEVSFVCTDDVAKSLAPYLYHRRTNLPYVVIKMATTMDGKIACEDRTSQWITGELARQEGHRIRKDSQAIIVGSGTVISDNPRLTVRSDGRDVDKQPLRIVIDRRGQLDNDRSYHLFDDSSTAETLILTDNDSAFKWVNDNKKVTVMRHNDGWSLINVLKELGRRDILQVMVEGGSTLHTSFIEQELVNQIVLFIGSTMFGRGALPWLTNSICKTITEARSWILDNVEKVNNDAKLTYLYHI